MMKVRPIYLFLTRASLYFKLRISGNFYSCIPGRIRYRHDHINLQILLPDFLSQEAAKIDPAIININFIYERVWPGKVDPFKRGREYGENWLSFFR
jgi:hypothetical protein